MIIYLSVQVTQNVLLALKEKMESFWPKNEQKFDQGFRENGKYFESNWLDIESEID